MPKSLSPQAYILLLEAMAKLTSADASTSLKVCVTLLVITGANLVGAPLISQIPTLFPKPN